jgi:hypothetical protein
VTDGARLKNGLRDKSSPGFAKGRDGVGSGWSALRHTMTEAGIADRLKRSYRLVAQ